jgi:tetratricopeptide (TPR) repeat protein
MIYKFLKIVKYSLPVTAVAVACTLQAAESKIVKNIQQDITQEVIEYQQTESKADIMVKAANKAYFSKKYKDAISKYLKAIDLLKSASTGESKFFAKKIATCKEQIYRSYYYWARNIALDADKLGQEKQFNSAIEMCQKAIAIYPPCKKRMEKRILLFKKQQKAVQYRTAATKDKLLPNIDDKDYNIQIMLKQGDAYYKAEKYYQARERYEQVLLLDPYKLAAIERLRSANTKICRAASPRKRAYTKERVAETQWKSVLPIKPSTIAGESSTLSTSPIIKVTSNDAIIKKLKNIIIPKIIFEDVSLPAAINHLRRISKQLDPEGVGVNIFLMLKKPGIEDVVDTTTDNGGDNRGAPGDDLAEDTFAEDTTTAGAGENGDGEDLNAIPTVTLRLLTSKSLGQVIHYVCKSAGVRYRIERYAVVVARKNIALDDLETRIYPVEESVLSSVGDDLRQYFVDSGIAFPDGAKVIYDRRISRLIVTNTPDNLTKIEQLIHEQLNSPDPQVIIQAKFIEIEQNDLNELSFNYALSRSLGPGETGTASGKLEFDVNNRVTRSMSNTNVFSYVTSKNGYDFAMQISAVDQANSTDLLASPRVVTMDGEEASIRMVREVYYPSDWGEATTSTTTSDNSSSYTYISPTPEFDEPTELGIVLKVTPKVDMDRRTITLHMNPTVQTFMGWTDYSYDVVDPSGLVIHEVLTREIIGERTVDTQVTVYDGETIVLGGIIRDHVQEITDKVPILGDVPLIGRFFQSRGTHSTKKNLLIFLTCRLVRPDGTLFDPATKSRGVPFFDRIK